MMDTIYRFLRSVRSAMTALSIYFKPSERKLFGEARLENIDIKPATADDIPILEKYFSSGDFMKHRNRLDSQEAGEGTYLIASRGVPIGHIYINWAGPEDGPRAVKELKAPITDDLLVHPAARGAGLGRKLMEEAERIIRDKGYGKVLGTVFVTNPSLLEAYRRMGYEVVPGTAVYERNKAFTDRNGRSHKWSRKVKFIIKDLKGEDGV